MVRLCNYLNEETVVPISRREARRKRFGRAPRPRLPAETRALQLPLLQAGGAGRRNEERERRRRVELSEARRDGAADSPRGASRARRRIRRRRTATRTADEAAGRRAARERERDRRRLSRAKARRDEYPRCPRGALRGRSGAEPSGSRRLAQDSAPSQTCRLASGRMDAQDAQAGGRAPLPRRTPLADRHGAQLAREEHTDLQSQPRRCHIIYEAIAKPSSCPVGTLADGHRFGKRRHFASARAPTRRGFAIASYFRVACRSLRRLSRGRFPCSGPCPSQGP